MPVSQIVVYRGGSPTSAPRYSPARPPISAGSSARRPRSGAAWSWPPTSDRNKSDACRSLVVKHDLFRKAVSTFRDHALALRLLDERVGADPSAGAVFVLALLH